MIKIAEGILVKESEESPKRSEAYNKLMGILKGEDEETENIIKEKKKRRASEPTPYGTIKGQLSKFIDTNPFD
jgi:hypothetical protein